MNHFDLLSDQYNQWSDRYAKDINLLTKKRASKANSTTSRSSTHRSGISYRALQALWKTRLQMRDRGWTWSEVLSVCEPAWNNTAHGLRSSRVHRADRTVFGKLSKSSRDSGQDMSDQSRVTKASRRALIGECVSSAIRHQFLGRVVCQHARGDPPCRTPVNNGF